MIDLGAWLGGLGGQSAGDRVQVDQRGGPCGLHPGFRAPDIAALAGTVAMREQPEEPLDPRAGTPEMLGGGGVRERLAAG